MKSKIKVLICVRNLNRGAAEMLECRLASNLNKMGVETHIMGQYSSHLFKQEGMVDFWHRQGIKKVYWLNSYPQHKFLSNLFKLKKIIETEKYSAVITHNSGLDIYVGACKLLNGNFKHVIAFHEYFKKTDINKLKFIIWKKAIKNADLFYCITEKVRSNIIHLFNAHNKSRTIYNSINTENKTGTYDPIKEQLHINSEKKIILSITRMHPNKGIDINLNLISKIKQNNFEYIIVGDKHENPAYYEKIKKQVSELGLDTIVHFVHFTDNAAAYMQQATLLLHMARHEGFGLVLIEAIAAGIPVVASNVGGIPEALQNTPYTPYGLDDEQKIVEKIEAYLSMTPDQLQGITQKAKEVLPYYTDERRALEIKELIETVCAE